jgi:ribonuclease HII
MTLVVGTDEAGYGPNLGPLVVAATAWRVDAAPADTEAAIAAAVAAAAAAAGPLWGDSKQIYRGGAGFAALERGALIGAALATAGLPGSWDELAATLGLAAGSGAAAPEAERLATCTLPVEAGADDCRRRAAAVATSLAARGVTLVAIRCRIVQPVDFNAQLDAGLNKSDILSQATLDLAAPLAAARADEPAVVWCDRHGGRRRYAGLLTRHFAAPLVRVVAETADASLYEIPASGCRVEFRVGGEARTPVALASMTAKYVRELAMRAFNAHWGALAPAVAPTAGYPVDAARWRREAAAVVAAAGIPWDELWRRA